MFTFLGLFAGFILAGVPIALALGVGAGIYLFLTGNVQVLLAFPQRMIAGVDQFVLLTIPLFLLAGALMNAGGITDRIIGFANAMVGHRRGGLSLVTVLASIFFAGISGSAAAQSSAIGSLMIPAMARQGIPLAYGAALVAVSAVIDPLIPPSITMIIFGVLSSTSIGQLFLAGVIPGILLGLGLLAYAAWKAKRLDLPVLPKADWATRRAASISALPALMLPVIIVGGIKFGIFTTTESAAVAVAYAVAVGFAYRDLTLGRIWGALCETAVSTSGLLFIVAMANIVSFVLTLERVPSTFAQTMLSLSDNRYVILILLNVMLLLLGKFLEPITIMILTMPILLEIAKLIGMDMVQFGVMVTINVVIGMATPPVGVCLFVVCSISGKSLVEVSKEVLPMLAICILLLALVALVPPITLFLPRAFGAVQ
jgi:C4-dicarboxylate transporter, DctM subunit